MGMRPTKLEPMQHAIGLHPGDCRCHPNTRAGANGYAWLNNVHLSIRLKCLGQKLERKLEDYGKEVEKLKKQG